ncbi:hypothetical protein ASO20_00340 [Mycoplasma sp. (ex Biomphalaria glabrata)]|uniref:YneF family protein n=1 Tax=Mycoplasma sp. (ex Biomphalaria glabrata) TaxID=1749074 RepID=UPI00073ADE08|nr:YneF family protein [Mycoplasma sp. (ex Biomphalaria glabrata)]ALV23130.1 hypothetical protein ASO20_00340 [Mycoplasma sp. (ex Biomphalaria glabrata)]
MEVWLGIVLLIIGLIAGGAGGFFLARKLIKKQLRENPPINEGMIRMMYAQMGRKPKEAQIKAILTQMNKNLK